MFKKIFTSIIASILTFSLVACSSQSTTSKYIEGAFKTAKADTLKLKSTLKIKISSDNATEKTKKNLDSFKDILINIDSSIDNLNKKEETSTYISAGELITSSKAYKNGDLAFLKSSFTNDKYLILDKSVKDATYSNMTGNINPNEYNKVVSDFRNIWTTSIEKEILTSEGTTVENTPDGDIKVSKLLLSLDDKRSKAILTKLSESISKNEYIKNTVLENSRKYIDTEKDKQEIENKISNFLNNMPNELEKLSNKFTIDNLKLTAKIDKDSFITEEIFEGIIKITGDENFNISFSSNTKRWNINKPVNIEIPELNSSNSSKIQDFKFDDTNFIENLKKKFKN